MDLYIILHIPVVSFILLDAILASTSFYPLRTVSTDRVYLNILISIMRRVYNLFTHVNRLFHHYTPFHLNI